MSRAMREAIPPDVEPAFLALMERLAEQYGVPWLPEFALSGPLPTTLFREQSHVNLAGAVRWTDNLARSLPANLLSEALPRCQERPARMPTATPRPTLNLPTD